MPPLLLAPLARKLLVAVVVVLSLVVPVALGQMRLHWPARVAPQSQCKEEV
jgi:hypothetical protein